MAQRPGIVAETKGSSTMCLRGSVRGGAAMDYPWNTKSVEQMVEEMNMALRESRTMSEQEKIEFDAEFGYTPDETSDTEDSEGCDDMDEIKVSKDALTPGELLNSMCTDDMDINDFISALDCLFAIGKVNYIEEGGLLGYVADKNQK